MVETTAHGGGCCGVIHISDFWRETREGVEKFKRALDNIFDEHFNGSEYEIDDWTDEPTDKKFSCLVEACLVDQQMHFWAPHLKEAGFKVVNRFLNSNSGNVVNVLHYNPAGRRQIEKARYQW
jgi:hypothetical protein